jgi:glyoxylase I family protein
LSLQAIRNFDYTILLCRRMTETRAFYRDVMGFPVELDLENRVSFRVAPPC